MSERIAYEPIEAGEQIGLGRTRVFEEIRAGRLRAKKLGRKTIILARDLRAFAESLPDRATAAARQQSKSARRKSHAR